MKWVAYLPVGLEVCLVKRAKNGKNRAKLPKVNPLKMSVLLQIFVKNMISLHEKTQIFEICHKIKKRKFSIPPWLVHC